jgi:hypothetical protein
MGSFVQRLVSQRYRFGNTIASHTYQYNWQSPVSESQGEGVICDADVGFGDDSSLGVTFSGFGVQPFNVERSGKPAITSNGRCLKNCHVWENWFTWISDFVSCR